MHHIMIDMCSEKCIIRQFHHCANIIMSTYANLDGWIIIPQVMCYDPQLLGYKPLHGWMNEVQLTGHWAHCWHAPLEQRTLVPPRHNKGKLSPSGSLFLSGNSMQTLGPPLHYI